MILIYLFVIVLVIVFKVIIFICVMGKVYYRVIWLKCFKLV